jgi:uncharacterized membrane protein
MQPPTDHVRDQIDTILKHEEEFLARRSPAERLGDTMASYIGSLRFVIIHLGWFAAWILFNSWPAGELESVGLKHFDPIPFSFLGTIVGLEAILLVSFILMRQARLARRADERDHLMLQILLLTEKEITAVIRMDQQIAGKMGLAGIAKDSEIQQMSQQTSIDDVAQTIQENLTSD